MKHDKDNIDLLLEQNASEQLARVDWQALNAAISSRLGRTSRTKIFAVKIPTPLRIAAGLAAAAVILIAVMVTVDTSDELRLENGRRAVVRLVRTAGTASVEIGHTPAKSQVFVHLGPAPAASAKCDVRIIDLEGYSRKNGTGAAWIIISRQKPVFADNGAAKDMKDLICMF
ncbi:MAG: hypothetical protein ACYTEQ_19035 [Planctomycetota bacterium]|jgi:hypothetical protein